ncbi:MAG: rhamnan synthesis F family protein [Subdoligranulum sp.]
MKKRLIIYFNYHPNGQADAACRFAVQQMAAVGQVFFVNNGPLQPKSRQWAQGCCHTVLERENTGFDVGAYRDAVLQIGLDMLLQYDEVVLMNYTPCRPVGDVAAMFAAMMGARSWISGLTCTLHAEAAATGFGGKAMVPIAYLNPTLLGAFPHDGRLFAYWQAAALPASGEDSVRLHETQFTAHFAALGYRWDTFVDTKDLASLFVNPIMACPKLLLADRGCPFFKRRSFFTPYADELRRTDGQAAAELW